MRHCRSFAAATLHTTPPQLQSPGNIWPHGMQASEVSEFVKSLQAVPKTGRHNPLKNPER